MNLQIVIFVCFFQLIFGKKLLHQSMHDHEIQAVFHRKRDTMHKVDYEVVQIHHRLNSPAPTVYLSAYSKNYTLYLEENDALLGDKTPIITARCDSYGNNIKYFVENYFNLPNVKFYHDRNIKASLVALEELDGRINIEGIIDDNIIIRSLPKRIHSVVFNGHEKNSHHVVMKINENHLDQRLKPADQNYWSRIEKGLQYKSTSSLAADEVLYIETMIAIDYNIFQIHGNLISLAKYMAAFWNAVDLRYRSFKNPKIRINVAGLLVPQSPRCVPFIENNFIRPNRIMVHKTLQDISASFKNNPFVKNIYPASTIVNYDLVVVMTNRDLIDETKSYETNYGGIALRGTVCGHVNGWNRAGSAIIRDSGVYTGITSAAHEIAHVLGAPHDGDTNFDYGPIKYKMSCFSDNGTRYMMNPNGGFHWSPCSISIIRHCVRQNTAACLKNKPFVGKPYVKILPGKVMTRNEQCKKLGYSGAMKANTLKFGNDCKSLVCENKPLNQIIELTEYPAEGSECDLGGICLDGECVQYPSQYKSNFFKN